MTRQTIRLSLPKWQLKYKRIVRRNSQKITWESKRTDENEGAKSRWIAADFHCLLHSLLLVNRVSMVSALSALLVAILRMKWLYRADRKKRLLQALCVVDANKSHRSVDGVCTRLVVECLVQLNKSYFPLLIFIYSLLLRRFSIASQGERTLITHIKNVILASDEKKTTSACCFYIPRLYHHV